MNLQPRNKIEASFSMASMTDLVFLLLVFFMLTSSFVTPSGLPVSLPQSKTGNIEVQRVSVTITRDLRYYVNEQMIAKNLLEPRLKLALSIGEDQGVVVLHIDKDVPTEELVYVAGIATALKAKVSIAVQPQNHGTPQ